MEEAQIKLAFLRKLAKQQHFSGKNEPKEKTVPRKDLRIGN